MHLHTSQQNKIRTARQAVDQIEDGSVVAINGFIMSGCPDELCAALEERFFETGHPRDLTLVCITSSGDGQGRGVDRLAHEGLISRIISSHYSFMPKIQRLILDEKIEAYAFPQGVISQLFRDKGRGHTFTLSPLGLRTFVDPRMDGGRLNQRTKKPLNELLQIEGREYIHYFPLPDIDYTLIRGSQADPEGNTSMRHEGAVVDPLVMAVAAKNSGGKVLVQAASVAPHVAAHDVRIPGIIVDTVAPVSDLSFHVQSGNTIYSPAYSGEEPTKEIEYEPVTDPVRRIVAGRCLEELKEDAVITLGIGMPESIAALAAEQAISDFTLTVDVGIIGGTPAGGRDFGCTINPSAILTHADILDYLHGGGLDQAFLGLAECDPDGNVNVSRFKERITGIGGFIDLTQSAQEVCFIGTFTAKGLRVEARGGKLRILQEGSIRKFRNSIEQRTFSALRAEELGQKVRYITERAVFSLEPGGLVLTEIAPGIDLAKDILGQMDFRPRIAPDLKEMNPALFGG